MTTGYNPYAQQPLFQSATLPPHVFMLPGDGWFAEVTLNQEVMFLRVICFVLSGDCCVSPPQGASMYSTYPKVHAMVSANQSIVPASLVPGFTRLVHDSELEEERQDEEDIENFEEEGEDLEDDEGCCACEGYQSRSED